MHDLEFVSSAHILFGWNVSFLVLCHMPKSLIPASPHMILTPSMSLVQVKRYNQLIIDPELCGKV